MTEVFLSGGYPDPVTPAYLAFHDAYGLVARMIRKVLHKDSPRQKRKVD